MGCSSTFSRGGSTTLAVPITAAAMSAPWSTMLTTTPLDDPYGRAPDSNNVAIPLSSSTGEFLADRPGSSKAKIVPEWRMRPD